MGEEEEDEPRAVRGEAVLPIAYAAVKASQNPGTEVDGTEVGGAKRGVSGRWVTLMRRRTLPTGEAETPQPVSMETGTPGEEPDSANAPTDDSAEASA
jgi:hypothetical protein